MKSALLKKAKLISEETEDLLESIALFEAESERQKGAKPNQGDGSEYRTDGYGFTHCVKEGLPQGATATAIERKIITIREHLNALRKLVVR